MARACTFLRWFSRGLLRIEGMQLLHWTGLDEIDAPRLYVSILNKYWMLEISKKHIFSISDVRQYFVGLHRKCSFVNSKTGERRASQNTSIGHGFCPLRDILNINPLWTRTRNTNIFLEHFSLFLREFSFVKIYIKKLHRYMIVCNFTERIKNSSWILSVCCPPVLQAYFPTKLFPVLSHNKMI